MLTESDVIDAVCRFLKRSGFRIAERRNERQRGIDIRGFSPCGREVMIEAKGETSSKSSSKRYGKAFSSNQAFDHVAKAFLTATACSSRKILSGIAIPKNAVHEHHASRIKPAMAKLGIEMFWVLPNGKVEVNENWKVWKQPRSRPKGIKRSRNV